MQSGFGAAYLLYLSYCVVASPTPRYQYVNLLLPLLSNQCTILLPGAEETG